MKWFMGLSILFSTCWSASGTAAAEAEVIPADAEATKILKQKVTRTLDRYYVRAFNSRDLSPWSIMHWSIAYGVDAEIRVGGPNGQLANAIGWLCYNYQCRGQRLMHLSGQRMALPIAPGVQGHHGQFLSMLAQSRVRPDYPIKIAGHELTVADLVQHEKQTCRARSELTFKLIGLSRYLPHDATWKNDLGEPWSISRLLEEELRQPIVQGACCGGTHRLMGFSYAVRRYQTQCKEPLRGPWQQADKLARAYQAYAFRLQNPDGSFSTAWFQGRGARTDIHRRLQTSGHILEWLAFCLPADKLQSLEMVRAVDHLADLLGNNVSVNWHPGSLGHALHALTLYEQRAFGAAPGNRRQQMKEVADRLREPKNSNPSPRVTAAAASAAAG